MCTSANAAPPLAHVTIDTKTGPRNYTLEIADTEETRATGLMHRDRIGAYDGMLFRFDAPGKHSFWMKNTRIPLDMLFIDTNGIIVHIEANAEPFSLAPRTPPLPALTVIELKGGRAAKDGVAVGDSASHTP